MGRMAGAEEQGCARMPESVELNPRQAGCRDKRGVLPLARVVGLEREAERLTLAYEVFPLLREDKPQVAVARSVGQPQLTLMPPMRAEQGDGLGRQ